jgi:signal transduction histidine kinase
MKFTRYTTLIISISILLIAILLFAYRLTMPFDGVQLVPGEWVFKPQGVEVNSFDERAASIHRGDLVVAVEGRSLDSWAQSLVRPGDVHPSWKIGQSVIYTVLRDGQRLDIPIKLERYPLGKVLTRSWSAWLVSAAFILLGLFIFLQRPNNRVILVLFLWIACLVGDLVFWTLGLQVSDIVMRTGFWLQSLSQHFTFLLFCSSILHFTLLFPIAQLSRQQLRWVVPTIYSLPLLLYSLSGLVLWSGSATALEAIGRWIQTNDVLTIALMIAMLIVLSAGYRNPKLSSGMRQQTRFVVLAIALCGICFALLTLAHFVTNGFLYGDSSLTWLLFLLGFLIPIAIIFAIIRYRLFRIRIIISRTLIYSLLTLILIGIYVVVVGTLSQLFAPSGNFLISLLATGLIAALAQPLRERVQHIINQLIYGQRDDPYGVLSRLGKRLEATLLPQEALPILVETVALALKLPYAAIALNRNETFVAVASYGLQQDDVIRLPILYQRETIGQLILAPRAPGETFTQADRQLLDHLAGQAGVAAHTVRLTSDLQRSREQLVTTREEERRRLRRDLHDGLGPTLASIMLKLEATRNLLQHDSAAADQVLVDLTNRVALVVADIRRLVYELRPPALDDLGLVTALRQFANQHNVTSGLQISVTAPEALPMLPAALEVAIYRIALEGLTNVIRHAQAMTCQVQITLGDTLALEISDDGRGLSEEHRSGVGLNSMRERSAELGGTFSITSKPEGGTRVLAQLPLADRI